MFKLNVQWNNVCLFLHVPKHCVAMIRTRSGSLIRQPRLQLDKRPWNFPTIGTGGHVYSRNIPNGYHFETNLKRYGTANSCSSLFNLFFFLLKNSFKEPMLARLRARITGYWDQQKLWQELARSISQSVHSRRKRQKTLPELRTLLEPV